MSVLPHRYPFLMVDRILGFEGETKITGSNRSRSTILLRRTFRASGYAGRPAGRTMAQVAGILDEAHQEREPLGYFVSADEVKFRKPVFPGDASSFAELTRAEHRLAKAKCHCTVNDIIVSQGELMFTFLDK
jgi:UDP-3-O-[3-hydroxymyristoyl] N-acetylglucosamine deacetylase/3-hydroxyacyl-[acyl-carrier-protein] dehydratase